MTLNLILLIFVFFVIGIVALKVLLGLRSPSSPEFDDEYASNPMDHSTEEQVLFNEKGVTVTPFRLVAEPHDYLLRSVRKANIRTVTINWEIGIVARTSSIVGAVFFVVGSILVSKDIHVPP